MLNLILLGAPGAGKGTQAERISQEQGIPQISTGAILRETIASGSELGQKVRSLVDAGELVPDEIVVEIVRQRITQPDCADGFILDGFPRTIPQAQALDEMLQKMGISITKVISIEVKDEDIIRRMSGRRVCAKCGASYHIAYKKPVQEGVCDKCGSSLSIRADDKPEVVADRLKVYHQQTAPLKDYYQQCGKLTLVEGQEELSQTTALVRKALEA